MYIQVIPTDKCICHQLPNPHLETTQIDEIPVAEEKNPEITQIDETPEAEEEKAETTQVDETPVVEEEKPAQIEEEPDTTEIEDMNKTLKKVLRFQAEELHESCIEELESMGKMGLPTYFLNSPWDNEDCNEEKVCSLDFFLKKNIVV